MSATTAKEINAALERNVDEYFAGRLTHAQFTERNRAIWDSAASAGVRERVNGIILTEERRKAARVK